LTISEELSLNGNPYGFQVQPEHGF